MAENSNLVLHGCKVVSKTTVDAGLAERVVTATRWAFAMANAHPRVSERAAYDAPSNDEHSVVTVLRRLLGV